MFTWKSDVTLLTAMGIVVIAAAPHYHKSRPWMRCSIPDREYQFKQFSQPIRSVSAVGVPLRMPALVTTGVPPPAIQAFQFVDMPTLKIDHCSLSSMSVLLNATGEWTVSCQADQNPVSGFDQLREVTTAEEQTKMTAHVQRNEFYVRITCYGRSGTSTESILGKPVAIPLEMKPFWVQRGVAVPYYATGHDARIAHYFSLIDRVQIDFAYRVE